MDLTIELQGEILNLRVVTIFETERGFLLEQHKKGYYFFPGGRIKLRESSLAAAKREAKEETGLDIESFEFVTVVENFYKQDVNVQEICFVYKSAKINYSDIHSDFGLKEYSREEIQNMDVKPDLIKNLVLQNKLTPSVNYIV